jgi:hypothetical protein
VLVSLPPDNPPVQPGAARLLKESGLRRISPLGRVMNGAISWIIFQIETVRQKYYLYLITHG